MKEYKHYTEADFSAHNITVNDETKKVKETLVEGLVSLTGQAAFRKYGSTGIIEKVDDKNYNQLNTKTTELLRQYFNLTVPTVEFKEKMSKSECMNAINTPGVSTVFFAVVTDAMQGAFVRYSNPIIERFANVRTVDFSEVYRAKYEPLALPHLQRTNRYVNTGLLNKQTSGTITITPKLYIDGFTIDVMDIMLGNASLGDALGKIYAGIVFAQQKRIVDLIFTNAKVSSTPFYASTFAAKTYTQLATAVGVYANVGLSGVTAYGTPVALQTLASSGGVSNGFNISDEYLRQGYVGKLLGIDTFPIEQFSNFAAPYGSDYASLGLPIPDDMVLLIANTSEKLVTLVRENWVRITQTAPQDNVINRYEFNITAAFEADFVSPAPYAVQALAL